MRLVITNKGTGRWAANYLREKINNFKPTEDKNFVLGLPTGGTAVDIYKNVVEYYKNKTLSFKNITTFNMDEYVGLPRDHKESYWTFMQENLFKHVDMDQEKINVPDGNAKDIKLACKLYEEKMKNLGGIRLFIGGVGENGHIAFNEPYSSLSSHTRDKELNKNTIAANSRYFDGNLDLVPKKAVTVGVSTLLDADEVLILVNGEKKAMALHHCVEGAISHLWPVSVLQFHKRAIIVVDEAATSELKVKTYKFFKELEDEYSYIDEI